MADEDLISGEDAKLRKARWEKLSERIAQDWAADGYYHRRHLETVTAAGERDVLRQFYEAERFGQRPMTLARYSVCQEILEIRQALDRL